jgi:hypothetical protein
MCGLNYRDWANATGGRFTIDLLMKGKGEGKDNIFPVFN